MMPAIPPWNASTPVLPVPDTCMLEQQGRDCQASELAQAALALAREVDRVAAFRTVDEKRTFVRAFLREIEFDPSARTETP
jgi:hypothetical protein